MDLREFDDVSSTLRSELDEFIHNARNIPSRVTIDEGVVDELYSKWKYNEEFKSFSQIYKGWVSLLLAIALILAIVSHTSSKIKRIGIWRMAGIYLGGFGFA